MDVLVFIGAGVAFYGLYYVSIQKKYTSDEKVQRKIFYVLIIPVLVLLIGLIYNYKKYRDGIWVSLLIIWILLIFILIWIYIVNESRINSKIKSKYKIIVSIIASIITLVLLYVIMNSNTIKKIMKSNTDTIKKILTKKCDLKGDVYRRL